MSKVTLLRAQKGVMRAIEKAPVILKDTYGVPN